jgi:OmcA/MtrC family decaheme c-type cytochrome
MRKSVFILLMVAGILTVVSGLSILRGSDANRLNALDRASYLAAEDAVWVRPGLNLQILNVSIGSDRKPVVTFQITDNGGQPLDKDGILTPDAVTFGYVISYIPANALQYVSYFTRAASNATTGLSTNWPTTDSGGKYTSSGNGTYTYTFGGTLPANYDQTVTHTLGMYAQRSMTEFGLSIYVANALKNFVPNGAQVAKVREVVATTACNQCHDPLALHGGRRRETGLCILCHTPQNVDITIPGGGTLDFKAMIHKLHMGSYLPSVTGKALSTYNTGGSTPSPFQGTVAGKPNIINGVDFSDVVFPRDIRSCATCHQKASQAANWQLNPSSAACSACHDDINWTTGANHVGGPQPNDNHCANCHYPQGDYEWDASVDGAHTVSDQSASLAKPTARIIAVSNTGPGQKPTVRFQIQDKNGKLITPSAMSRLSLRLAGPTTDYKWFLSETATAATVGVDSIASYTFAGALPADATGTYSVGVEGRITTNLKSIDRGAFTYSDGIPNVLKYFAVTGTTVTPRRKVVDVVLCNGCHERLQLHGNSRNDPEYCVGCHNPTMTATVSTGKPDEGIHFKWQIHKIHRGGVLENGYQIGTNNLSYVAYPGDLRDCVKCHVGTSYTLPLPANLLPTVTPRNYWTPTAPVSAACLGCHDSVEAAAHALINTASFGESCSVCHKEGAEFAVTKVHAR